MKPSLGTDNRYCVCSKDDVFETNVITIRKELYDAYKYQLLAYLVQLDDFDSYWKHILPIAQNGYTFTEAAETGIQTQIQTQSIINQFFEKNKNINLKQLKVPKNSKQKKNQINNLKHKKQQTSKYTNDSTLITTTTTTTTTIPPITTTEPPFSITLTPFRNSQSKKKHKSSTTSTTTTTDTTSTTVPMITTPTDITNTNTNETESINSKKHKHKSKQNKTTESPQTTGVYCVVYVLCVCCIYSTF